ncbi:unnamed protein product [Rotaria sp. Silwood1]|nr:unnamed protein product [Rotaria sp. Silwood1]CAF1599744.1 unnamed protein product [Rotaria sp. Silwood1]CAF3681103.1 unnamed protein product [Rotaria sp. Silwood1]CAF3706006.1 unnamed protein product [Rotaria sp. Silwood1]CAF3710537.1 unnamed protein product [Rotaria sp. Silwood1]
MADLDGPTPYQSTCDPTSDNGTCSNTSLCQCATTVTGENICTQQMSCEYGTPCDSNNTCAKPNSTCVIDNRCPGRRLCYSIVIFSPEFCPPLVESSDASIMA